MGPYSLAGVVIFTGFTVVFAALVLLIVLIKIVGLAGKEKNISNNNKPSEEAKSVIESAPSAPPSNVQMCEEDIPDEIVAVISAAVAAMMNTSRSSNYVVRSIKRTREARPAWGMAGILENTRPF